MTSLTDEELARSFAKDLMARISMEHLIALQNAVMGTIVENNNLYDELPETIKLVFSTGKKHCSHTASYEIYANDIYMLPGQFMIFILSIECSDSKAASPCLRKSYLGDNDLPALFLNSRMSHWR